MTLPPPVWTPASAFTSLREIPSAAVPPPPRKTGMAAEEARLRAQLAVARASGSPSEERTLTAALARWLGGRERDLAEGAQLGERALELGEASELRHELATWYASLGQHEQAAKALLPLLELGAIVDEAEAAAVAMRAALSLARAGLAPRADKILARAMRRAPEDGRLAELRALVLSWSSGGDARTALSSVFVEAARRYGRRSQTDPELENALRAFDAAPADETAAHVLGTALRQAGHADVADEVQRLHAAALRAVADERYRAVHAGRRAAALLASDVPRALGASFDEGLDAVVVGSLATSFDEILERAGLVELLAVRLELRAEQASGAERGRLYEELARRRAGPLASPDDAAVACIAALGADPGRVGALELLRAHAEQTGDRAYLVEGLVRGTLAAPPSDTGAEATAAWKAGRLACAEALAAVAEDADELVLLAAWAYDQMGALDPGASASRAWFARHGGRVDQARAELEEAREAANETPGLASYRRLAELLRTVPEEAAEYGRVLALCAAAEPRNGRAWRLARLLAWRRGDLAEVARLAQEQIGATSTTDAHREARAALAAAHRARGDHAGACDALRDLLAGTEPVGAAAASLVLVHAALTRDASLHADALAALASSQEGAIRGMLLAVAAEGAERLGDVANARSLALAAHGAAPGSLRALSALAQASLAGRLDGAALEALQRACEHVLARGEWTRSLADGLASHEEHEAALAWTRAWVAVAPGEISALERIFHRSAMCSDARAVSDALVWTLAQPIEASRVTGPLAGALHHLCSLDAPAALVLSRRALDVFGPAHEALREAMLSVARAAGEPAFAAVVLERWRTAGAPREERGTLWQRIVDLTLEAQDGDGAARALLRAARAGEAPDALLPKIELLAGLGLSGDGELARLEARALVLSQIDSGARVARAWRELGAARWDLLGDGDAALEAWIQAAEAAPALGYATLGTDLLRFSDARYALAALSKRMGEEQDPTRAGALAAEAARAALALGQPSRALELATLALERSPSCGPALAVAERAAVQAQATDRLSTLYDWVSSRALGRFGRRAAHHRAARFYEGAGAPALALKHAASAFQAVPSEGSSLVLLERAALAARDSDFAIRVVESVAEESSSPVGRAGWLMRAARFAPKDGDGARVRVDLLLRAFLVARTPQALRALRDAVEDALRAAPEDESALEVRLGRAAKALLPKLEGPDGARVALALSDLLLSLFTFADVPLSLLEKAIECDGDLEEYAKLGPYATRLAGVPEAPAVLERLVGAIAKPYANVGAPAANVLAAMAHALGDVSQEAIARVVAAERASDDEALVRAADTAVLAAGDEALLKKLDRKLPPTERAEAFASFGRARADEGAWDAAVPALERAVSLADATTRPTYEADLRRVLEAAGRGQQLEARALEGAQDAGISVAARAELWDDLATRRENRGELAGALEAIRHAVRLDGSAADRWATFERLAVALGDRAAQVQALAGLARALPEESRGPVLRRLARAQEEAGDLAGAESTLRAALHADPEDEDADVALESIIVGAGRYEDLAALLERRAARLARYANQRERLRAVRLRRTAILEQRLGRLPEAIDELRALVAEWPESTSALRYLADLHERAGEPALAVPLWRTAATHELDPAARGDLGVRAARAALAAGDAAQALALLGDVLAMVPGHPEAVELRVAAARATQDEKVLGEALEDAAAHLATSATERGELLVEAAQAAARTGELPAALSRAQRAAACLPDNATAQLFARGLEYRMRGAGAPADARRTLEQLDGIRGPLGLEDEAIRLFLYAEALDAVHGRGAGLRELTAVRDELRRHALVSVGIAERLNAQGNFAAAVGMFERALTGEFYGLRRRGAVALAAADAALRAGQPSEAKRFLEDATSDAETRASAQKRLSSLHVDDTEAPGTPSAFNLLEAELATATTPARREEVRLLLARALGSLPRAEALLLEGLAEGSVACGAELALRLEEQPARWDELLRLRRRLVEMAPGDIELLTALRRLLAGGDDLPNARAIEHVLRAFDPGAGPLPAPPLSAQTEQPSLLSLLARPSLTAVGQALGQLWEDASSLFLRDPTSYGLADLERVVPGAPTATARLYEMASRLLDLPKIPVFLQRTDAALDHHVALVSPPSVILTGDPREDTAELRYALGAALAAALPQNVLLLGLPEQEARTVYGALLGAFGPPELGRSLSGESGRLAESLWHLLPAASQRRVQELLSGGRPPSFEEARAGALATERRVGLFLAGEIEVALFALLRDVPSIDATLLRAEGGLKVLADRVPEAAELLRLAVSPEYVAARWRAPSTPSRPSAGRLSLY